MVVHAPLGLSVGVVGNQYLEVPVLLQLDVHF